MQKLKTTFKTKIDLPNEELPKQYYNILADIHKASKSKLYPPLHPQTLEPATEDDLAAIFPSNLIQQETSTHRYIDIPEPVRDIYRRYRPSPLYRAKRFEQALKTRAKIYFKYEGVSPPGSHKPNTAIPQAYYNMKAGVEKLYTETGAGQWGTALSYAGLFFDLEVEVFMVGISYDQKPHRRTIMNLFDGIVHRSPSKYTKIGRKILKKDPDTPGSLGIAISEAIEKVLESDNAKYSLGSVLNHVLLHQTIIGQEAQQQLAMVEEQADYVIGCLGGGSNFGGTALPFVRDKINGDNPEVRCIAVESNAAPKMTRGKFLYDYGDSAGMTPLMKMFTVGHDFIPPPVHAGGLRYHGCAPILSHLLKHQVIEGEAYPQVSAFKAAKLFAKSEGLVPAPETSHAIRSTIEYARKYPRNGNKDRPVILFTFSGHGLLDLKGYEKFFANKLKDHPLKEAKLKQSLAAVPKVEQRQLENTNVGC